MAIDPQLIAAAEIAATSDNETEIEQKLVVPLLRLVGIQPADYLPQEVIPRFDIDKGRNSKQSWRPDHLLKFHGLWVAVIENKKSSESVMDAWRQAQMYTAELHRNNSAESNIIAVMGCNGKDIAVGTPKTPDSEVHIFSAIDVIQNPQRLAEFEQLFGRKRLEEHAEERRLERKLGDPSSVRSLLLGNGAIPHDKPHAFASALRDVLDDYCGDIGELPLEAFNAAYCAPSLEARERAVEDIIRDRAPAHTEAKSLVRETVGEVLGEIVDEFHRCFITGDKIRDRHRFTLIIGGAGVGKTTLLKWFDRFELDPKNHFRVWIDGTRTPQDQNELYHHILTTVVDEVYEGIIDRFLNGDRETALRDILRRDWKNQRAELFSHLPESEYLQKHFPQLAEKIRADPAQFLKRLVQYVASCQCSIILVLDNLDAARLAYQVEAFRTARPFASQFPILCLMALREETYRANVNSPPFNAFREISVFHVPAPRAMDVIGKRISVLANVFKGSKSIAARFTFGDMKMELTRDALFRILEGVYLGVRSEHVLNIIDGVCGGNVRRGLEVFRSICLSSHIGAEFQMGPLFRIGDFQPSRAAIVKAVVCRDWRYFSRESQLVANAYTLLQGEDGDTVFAVLHMLRILLAHAPATPAHGKGFCAISDLRNELHSWIPASEAQLRHLLFELHRTGIWEVDTLEPQTHLDFSAVRIKEPGLYLFQQLYTEEAYLDAMAFDTLISEPVTLGILKDSIQHDRSVVPQFKAYLAKTEEAEHQRAKRRGFKYGGTVIPFFPI